MATVPQMRQELLGLYRANHGTFGRLRANELSPTLLSRYTGTNLVIIYNAIRDGRLRPFIRRTIRLDGQRVPIFAKKDLHRIREKLPHHELRHGPGEMTTGMLARRLGTVPRAINYAVKQGELEGLVKPGIKRGANQSHVFNDRNLDEIDSRLFTNPDDTTLLADRVEFREIESELEQPFDPEAICQIREIKRLTKLLLADSDPTARKIMRLYFDLDDRGRDHTMEEIGKKFKLTRSRVQQVIHHYLKIIRKRLGRLPL